MASNRHTSLEAKQEILPDRLDGFEPAPVNGRRNTRDEPARMRRGGGHTEAHERTELRGNAMERVAFRHVEEEGRFPVV